MIAKPSKFSATLFAEPNVFTSNIGLVSRTGTEYVRFRDKFRIIARMKKLRYYNCTRLRT